MSSTVKLKAPRLGKKELGLILAGLALGLIPACGEAQVPPALTDTESQSVRTDLYQCDGCEGALERNPASLGATATIADASEQGERMIIEGIVYQADGRTPAPNVVIYAYHTNAAGLYAGGSPDTAASRRHGRLRGWVKTGADGRYQFNSIKPAPYPNDRMPAHVHLMVSEPARPPYWIDEIVFEREFGVTRAYRRSQTGRGGSGIIQLTRSPQGVWLARRNIVLERHPS
jgi:protocatechuate 3,4-dioxygenase beta subunit